MHAPAPSPASAFARAKSAAIDADELGHRRQHQRRNLAVLGCLLGRLGLAGLLGLGGTALACGPGGNPAGTAPVDTAAPVATPGGSSGGGSGPPPAAPAAKPWAIALGGERVVSKLAALDDGFVVAMADPRDNPTVTIDRRRHQDGALTWSFPVKGTGSVTLNGLAADSRTGDVAVLLGHGGDVTVGPHVFTRSGFQGGYVVLRLTGAGALAWATALPTSSAAVAYFDAGLTVAPSGDVLLPGVANLAQKWGTESVQDGFVLALRGTDGQPSASVSWTRADGTFYPPYPRHIVRGKTSTWITGVFSETARFGATTLTANGPRDGFLVELGERLEVLRALPIGGSGADGVTGLAVDRSGRVFLRGSMGTATSWGGTMLSGDYLAGLDAIGGASFATPYAALGASVPVLELFAPRKPGEFFLRSLDVAVDDGGRISRLTSPTAGVDVAAIDGATWGRVIGGFVTSPATIFGKAFAPSDRFLAVEP